MPRIDIHAVTLHCILNLSNDRLASRFNPKNLFNLHDMVRRRLFADDTYADVKSERIAK